MDEELCGGCSVRTCVQYLAFNYVVAIGTRSFFELDTVAESAYDDVKFRDCLTSQVLTRASTAKPLSFSLG